MLVENDFTRFSFIKLATWLLGMGLFLAWSLHPAAAQALQVAITQPIPGDALQGMVPINGTSAVEGFRSAEVDFAYQSDSTNTWFIVQQASAPVTGGMLAKWDTTTISDGVYRLRLLVSLQNGQVVETQVTGLRVRNYTQVETRTPQTDSETINNLPTEQAPTALTDFQPDQVTPAAQPTNPVQVTLGQMEKGARQGMLITFGSLAVVGLYLGIRAFLRRS